MVSRRKASNTRKAIVEPLGLAWPRGAISLSHIALAFPPDDPLYGRHTPEKPNRVFLGQLEIQGERGLLKVPADWLLRMRHNPFYSYLEGRMLDWVNSANPAFASSGSGKYTRD